MAEPARSRRSVFKALILSLPGGAALWRFLTPRPAPGEAGGTPLAVAEADVPVDGALVLPEQRCAVVRRGGGLMALDLACPHLGCTVTATAHGFACPCHGSRFGEGGEILRGPAARPLARLRVESSGGLVRVFRGEGGRG
jgi:Rieske Fe-S protein